MFRFDSRVAALRARLDDMRRFIRTETGAVTVDWVVMAAAVVGLGIASVGAVRSGAVSLGDGIGSSLSGAVVADLSGGESGAGGGWTWQTDYEMGAWGQQNREMAEAQIGGWTDQQLTDLYSHYLNNYGADGVDVAYLILSEMDTRGIATPEQYAEFEGVANP